MLGEGNHAPDTFLPLAVLDVGHVLVAGKRSEHQVNK